MRWKFIQVRLDDELNFIYNKYRKYYEKMIQKVRSIQDELRIASCWYMLAYTDTIGDILSFPWVIGDKLKLVIRQNMLKGIQFEEHIPSLVDEKNITKDLIW